MSIEECWKLVYVIKSQYPGYYARFTEKDYESMAVGLHLCLEEYTYEQASKGLKAFLKTDTKGFPPTPGQIIEHIHKLCQNDDLLPAEAWALVRKAIGNGTYGAEAEYAKLPVLVQKAIGSPAYLRECATDEGFSEGVAKGQFEKNYTILIERERYNAKIPPSMKIETQERMMIE